MLSSLDVHEVTPVASPILDPLAKDSLSTVKYNRLFSLTRWRQFDARLTTIRPNQLGVRNLLEYMETEGRWQAARLSENEARAAVWAITDDARQQGVIGEFDGGANVGQASRMHAPVQRHGARL